MIANVYLLDSNFIFDNKYSYIIPTHLVDDVSEGVFVTVPFGKGDRKTTALVWDLQENYTGGFKLKEILSVSDIEPLTKKEMLLAKKMHEVYLCTIGEAARCMIPPEGKKGRMQNAAKLARSMEETKKLIDSGEFRNIKYIKVLEALYEGPVLTSELMNATQASSYIINKLRDKGHIVVYQVHVLEEERAKHIEITSSPLVLNSEQKAVYEEVCRMMEKGEFAEVLLHGITGSGKTEVYMQLIAKAMEKGGNSILLVPEISLTPQMVGRLTSRFGNKVAILHSRLTDNERNLEWKRIRRGEVSVAVGARSCVFAPFDTVSLFIIDEEQEDTYKSDDLAPRYLAHEVCVMRAKMDGSIVVYGSATPNVSTYYRAVKGDVHLFTLKQRAKELSLLPPVEIVDMRKEMGLGENIFSQRLLMEMKKNLEAEEQTVLFINRRGFSRNMQCLSCGKTMKCRHCNIPMTLHLKQDRIVCHYCGNTAPAPKTCPNCKSVSFVGRGIGTEKVEEVLKKQFPGCTVVRMDTDTTSIKDGHAMMIQKFRDERADFLVGTQMIAKGHDFPLVTLVGVINADSLINLQDYRAQEKAYQLLTQVSGRAGRDELPGRVIIQAYNIDDYAIDCAAHGEYEDFYRNEILVRQKLWYPPFCEIGAVRFSGVKDKEVYDLAALHRKVLADFAKGKRIEVLGPTRSGIPKINNKYRWRIIVKCADRDLLVALFRQYLEEIRKSNKYMKNDISMMYDINPRFMI
ncbi:MAG: primosomal protein N' [Clostridiaceae bacterium]|nr:primosomal protein N' [Clostridiaceae bacterium]